MVKELLGGDPVLPLHAKKKKGGWSGDVSFSGFFAGDGFQNSLFSVNSESQILGEDTVHVNSLNTARLEILGEFDESGVVVSLSHEDETTAVKEGKGK